MIFFDMNVSHVFLSQITKIKKITDNKLCKLSFTLYSIFTSDLLCFVSWDSDFFRSKIRILIRRGNAPSYPTVGDSVPKIISISISLLNRDAKYFGMTLHPISVCLSTKLTSIPYCIFLEFHCFSVNVHQNWAITLSTSLQLSRLML